MKPSHLFTIGICLLMLASCASKKNIVTNSGKSLPGQPPASATSPAKPAAPQPLSLIQRIENQAQTTANITSKANLTLTNNGRQLSFDGSVYLRRGEVVRIQVTPFGLMEAARLEFTPEYVLIIDRIHKEYIKEDYRQVDFLANNGIDFNALEALFWNRLFVPGSAEPATRQADAFAWADTTFHALTLLHDKLKLTWQANADSRIESARASYAGKQSGTSSLEWTYGDFQQVGGKPFPLHQIFSFVTTVKGKQRTIAMDISMKKPRTNDDWEAQTTVSKKYKKVSVEEVLNKITN